jgi:hypothetical protein
MHTGLKPPGGAVVLFDGTNLANWTTRSGEPAGWTVADGVATVAAGAGDIVSQETFRDAYLHIEFRCPDMPEATGQAKGNSGVYLQARYEIQVLDSYGWEVPGLGDCGAIYNQHAPLVNACKPAMEWQSYDIAFRAVRCDESGEVAEKARVTVIHNGIVIHNNVELQGPTGGAVGADESQPGPLLLQDHGNPVSYRNVWLVHLPEKGSDQYEPS